MAHKSEKLVPIFLVRLLVVLFAIVVLTMILLSASNYPVQWKEQINNERMRYLEVYSQALEYRYLDYDNVMPSLPETEHMISNIDSCSMDCPALGRIIECYNMLPVLVPGYMRELLRDPIAESETSSGFYIKGHDSGFTVGSCFAYFGEDISIEKSL